jgi:prophage regulatory protein
MQDEKFVRTPAIEPAPRTIESAQRVVGALMLTAAISRAPTAGLAHPEAAERPAVIRRFRRFPELAEVFGISFSRMHIDRLEKAGKFPQRVRLGANAVAWYEDELIAWQAARGADRKAA